jgi:two-component system nitrogen regulation sensor histidine kinase NtrY
VTFWPRGGLLWFAEGGMARPTATSSPRKRFRRRLVAVMLVAGLLPVLVWALAASALADRVLAVSLEPLEDVLDRVDERLAGDAAATPLVAELSEQRLQLAQAELGRRSLRRLAPWGFLAVVATSATLLFATALVFGRALSRKLEGLADAAAAYARGDLSRRVAEPRVIADEIDVLVQQFNHMGVELEAQRQRLEITESLAAWQDVARTMAHDLKNPLTAIRLSLARLRSQGELVEAVEGELDVLMRLTASFSDFARLPAPVFKPVELRALLEEVCSLYNGGGAGGATVTVEPGARAEVAVRGDADQLRRALGNLVKNALEASPPSAAPVAAHLHVDGHEAVVAITDHGPGIAEPLDGRRLVRTLGTTKPGGSGLGLPIAAKIVLEHTGTLRLEPAAGGGTRALVRLPLAEGAA